MPLNFEDIRQCYHILQQQYESLSETESQKINQLKNATTEFSALISQRINSQEALLDAAQLDELNKWNVELTALQNDLADQIHALSTKILLPSTIENEEKSPYESSMVDSLLEFSRGHPEIAQTLMHLFVEQFNQMSGESSKKKKEFISHFSKGILRNIKDETHAQKILMEVAQQVAILDPKKFPRYIQEFNITRNDLLIELARLSANQSAKATAKFFHHFGIKCETPQDFASIKDIILICSKGNDYDAVAKHIKNFGIDSKSEEGQSFLVEFAQNIFAKDFSLFRDIIENFEIDAERPEGHQVLVEMAKIVANSPMGHFVAANFQKLGFKSDEQDIVVQLAKDISKNKSEIAIYIPYFQIDPSRQKDLIEIAMNAIRNIGESENAASILSAIENFKIDFTSQTGKDALIRMATEAIQKNAEATIENLDKFHLDIHTTEGKQVIVQIIKEGLLSKQAYKVIKNIDRLGFDPKNEEDQNILFDLAKFAAKHCWEEFCYFPDKFDIASERHRQILLDLALAQNPSAIKYYDDFELSEKNEIEEVFTLTAKENLTKEEIERCFSLLQAIAKKNHFDIAPLIQSIQEIEKKAKNETQALGLQKKSLHWLAFTLHRVFNIEGANAQKIQPEIQRILNLRSPQLREICGNRLIENLSNPSAQTYFESLNESTNVAHSIIPNVFLVTLFQQGISKSVIEECANEIKMLKRDKSQQPLFREATINKLLLKTLNALIEDKQLSSLEKELLLKNLFKNVESSADVQNRLTSLFSLLSLSRGALIKNILESNKKIKPKEIFEQIEKELNDSVQRLLPIKTEMIKDFPSKWSNFYQYLREPKDLFTYATGLSRLPADDRDEVMPYLGKFIETSLEGTFKEARYKGSAHLDLLKNQLGEEKWRMWQQGESSSLETFLSQETTETKKAEEKPSVEIPFEERFTQALKSNMEETEYPILFDYLKNPTNAVMNHAIKMLTDQLKKVAQDLKATKDPGKKGEFKNIQRMTMIQRRTLEFLNTAKKERIQILNDLLPFFDEANSADKFSANDKKFQKEMLAMVQVLENPEKKVEEKSSVEMSFEERFKKALKSNMEETEYPILFDYLKNPTNAVMNHANEMINEQLQKVDQALKVAEDPKETERLKNIQRKIMIQRRALDFLNPPKNELIKILNDLLPFFDEENPANKLSAKDKKLQKDMLAFAQVLENPEEAGLMDENVGYIITDTDDGCDNLEAGTEIKGGSCQDVGGDERLNKGLLSFILDGKNRMIAIKQPSGVIETRAFIRLLLDKNNQPVLFLEKIYPKICSDEHQKAIIKMAKKRAAALGVPLLSVDVQAGKPYPHSIKSLGSNAPYDYVDANSLGLRKTYTIDNACFVT